MATSTSIRKAKAGSSSRVRSSPEHHSAAQSPLWQLARSVDVEEGAAGWDMIAYSRYQFDDGVVLLGKVGDPGSVQRHYH